MKSKKQNDATRKKYTAAIESALRLLAKAPRSGTELAKNHKAHKATAAITEILVMGGLVTTQKDGRKTMYRLTDRGASRSFKTKPLLDRYFKHRAQQFAGYKAKPKAKPETNRPAVVQLSLMDQIANNQMANNSEQALINSCIVYLNSKGYTILPPKA